MFWPDWFYLRFWLGQSVGCSCLLMSLSLCKLSWLLKGEIKMTFISILQALKPQKVVIFWMSWTWLTYMYWVVWSGKLQLIFNEFLSSENVGNAILNKFEIKINGFTVCEHLKILVPRENITVTRVPFNRSVFGLCYYDSQYLLCLIT